MQHYLTDTPQWARDAGVAAAAILAALVLHRIAVAVLTRAALRTATVTDDVLVRRLAPAGRWLGVAVALLAVRPVMQLGREGGAAFAQVAGLVVPGLLGWWAVSLLNAMEEIVQARSDITVADNLRARRRRTRTAILKRIGIALVILIAACLMLMAIPGVRTVGVTLVASAGLAALAVGAAAQPALKNLIAGIQMAFTEPIRIDDVVIVDGEWGRIEEIRLTLVIVRLWDERRLVVPVSRFLEQTFQNWTRETSQLLGSVFLHLDPAADIPRLRAHLAGVVQGNPRWDGRSFGLQVTDTKPGSIEVRILVTARDASTAFDLRCDVREAMLAFVAAEMPQAIVRGRQAVALETAG